MLRRNTLTHKKTVDRDESRTCAEVITRSDLTSRMLSSGGREALIRKHNFELPFLSPDTADRLRLLPSWTASLGCTRARGAARRLSLQKLSDTESPSRQGLAAGAVCRQDELAYRVVQFLRPNFC